MASLLRCVAAMAALVVALLATGTDARPRARRAQSSGGCPSYPFLRAVPLPDPLPAGITQAISSINASLSALLAIPSMPGFAFSASDAGSPIATFAGGVADLSKPSNGPVDPSTAMFRIASNTKLFMSLLTHIFHAKGYLRLDDPINLYAPSFRTMPWDDGYGYEGSGVTDYSSNVTFRMLASHTSGLPDSLPGIIDWTNITTQQAFDAIAMTPLQNALYGFPGYSNLGIAVLGHVLSEFVAPAVPELRQAGSTDLASLLNRFIIGPLGLNHTAYNSTDPLVTKYLTPGYYPNGQVVGIHSLGWAAPAGIMFSTVVDMNAMMQAVASCASAAVTNDDDSCGKLGLWPALAKQFLQPVSYLPDGSLIVGSPWETVILDGGYVVRTKSGTLDGYSTKSGVLPELRLSFSFTYNANFDNWYQGDALLRTVAGLLVGAVEEAILPLQPLRPMGPQASLIAGNYTSDEDPSGATVAVVQIVQQELQMTVYSPGSSPFVATLGYAAVQQPQTQSLSQQGQPQLYRLYQSGFNDNNCEHIFMQDAAYGWPAVFTPTPTTGYSLAMSGYTGGWTKTA